MNQELTISKTNNLESPSLLNDLTTEVVYGVEEMLDIAGNMPLHSFTAKEIEDYGELCDQDCQDCD